MLRSVPALAVRGTRAFGRPRRFVGSSDFKLGSSLLDTSNSASVQVGRRQVQRCINIYSTSTVPSCNLYPNPGTTTGSINLLPGPRPRFFVSPTNTTGTSTFRYLPSIRWLNTGSSGKNSKEPPIGTRKHKVSRANEETSEPTSSATNNLDPRAFLLGTRQSLRHRVADFQVGDVVAVYAIGALLAAILISPIVGQYMRGSESTYDELDTEDVIADLARVLRTDLSEEREEMQDKGVVDTVLADVLSSKALQEQAIKFVVTILQSDQVKSACQKLLKDLWNDLVKDPETTAQIIFVLNMAIQNEDIRLAVKKLVLEIVEDEQVLEEMVRLLQKLGHDQEVLDATRALLTESAHNTLNDPEILDHSMEFATDVVGDDVVQRTAGEALRNSVSYAVQPSISIVLAATGVGLLIFSVISLGYARSSEQEAKVLDAAISGLARSLQPSRLRFLEPSRLGNLIRRPFQVVGAAVSAIFTAVLLPFQFVQRTVARIEYTYGAATKGIHVGVTWLSNRAGTISSMASSYGKAISGAFFGSLGVVSTTIKGATHVLAGVWNWSLGSMDALYLWWSGASEKFGQNSNSISRGVSTRAWVIMDAVSSGVSSVNGHVSWGVSSIHGYIVAFAEMVVGRDRTSRV